MGHRGGESAAAAEAWLIRGDCIVGRRSSSSRGSRGSGRVQREELGAELAVSWRRLGALAPSLGISLSLCLPSVARSPPELMRRNLLWLPAALFAQSPTL